MDFYRQSDKEPKDFWLDLIIIVGVIIPLLSVALTVARCMGLP